MGRNNRAAHLDFLNQPLNQLEVKNATHRTMNSTHGPFFQKGNNLPPLSAMNKHEKSTAGGSDLEGKASVTKRAATNMEIRTDRDAIDLSVHKRDPFYS